MKQRVSSHDVARKAGVSQSTVSLVLNGRTEARIPEETRRRVFDAARSLNYTRNAAARALVTGRTQRIGVVLNHPQSFRNRDNYHGDIMAGIIDATLYHNYNLLFHSAQYPQWQSLRDDILSGAADGVLLIGRFPPDELTPSLLQARFPTVCVNYHPDCDNYYAVDCDNEMGGYLAAMHAIALGHRAIVFISAGDDHSWARERKVGVMRAVTETGLAPSCLIAEGVAHDEPPEDTARRLLAYVPRPTAIIFSEEYLAQAVEETLPALGLSVPDDISIISYNSTTASERARPPMTSVYQPLTDIGHQALDLLVDIIEGKHVEPGVRRLPVRLDVRDSSGPAPDDL